MSGSRIYELEPAVIQQLGTGEFDGLEVIEVLPDALLYEEVNALGLRVSTAAELSNPSRDGVANGRSAEDEALFTLGAAAIVSGDTITADSIIKHLTGKRPRTIAAVVGAFTLKRELKTRSNDWGLQTG